MLQLLINAIIAGSFAALMAGVSVIFIWMASRYKTRDYFEQAPPQLQDAAI